MHNPTDYLSGSYLFGTVKPTTPFHILTAALVLLFLVSAFVYWRRGKLARDNPPLRRLLRRMARAGMWIAGIGLFIALMRYAQVDYLDMRIWMYLLLLAFIVTVGYFVYDISERYPLAKWRHDEANLERRYRPAGRRRPEPQPVRSTRERGKRRR